MRAGYRNIAGFFIYTYIRKVNLIDMRLIKTIFLVWFLIGANFILHSQKQIIPQNGHAGSFIVSLSNDDKQMLSTGIDGKIISWDLVKTKAIKHLKVSSFPLLCSDWNKDNTKFLTGGVDSVLRQFNATNYEKIREFKLGFGITKSCFHPSLNAIAIGGNSGILLVVDSENGGIYHEINIGSYITGLEFSSNGAILFVSSWENGIMAFEMKEGKKMLTIPAAKEIKTSGMSVSKDNQLLFMHLNNGTTEAINTFKAEALGSISNQLFYDDNIDKLFLEPAFTNENRYVINANSDNNMVIADRISNTQTIYKNIMSSGKINSIVPSNNGGFFILTDVDGTMSIVYFNDEIYKAELSLVWRKMQFMPERIFDVDFIHDGDVLAMKGNGYYNFNLRTGDMYRRDDDSARINASEYFVRYVAMAGVNDIYYYTDLVKHIGYTINGTTTTPLKAFAYSDDTSILAIQNSINEILVYNISTKKIVYHNKSKDESQLFNGVLANSFIFQKGNILFKIDPITGETKGITLSTNSPISYACHDKKLNTLYLLDNLGNISAYNNKTGERNVLPSSIQNLTANLIEVSDNGKYLAVSHDNKISLVDISTSKIAYEIDNPFGVNYSLSLNIDGSKLAVANEDGIVRIFDTNKKQLSFNVIPSQQNGILVYDANNYYMATKEAARQLVIKDEKNIYSLESFDLLYNRPDIILGNIGLANDRLVSAYKFAYERRLKKSKSKLGNTNVELPVLTLTNRNEIKATTILNEIDLQFKISESAKSNAKINVWINDVPIKTTNVEKKGDELSRVLNLKLLSGTNKIKYSLTTETGVESEKEEIVVVNLSSKKPNLYLLTIGTSEYKDKNFNLNYAAKDANDITKQFLSNGTDKNNAFEKVFTQTIINADVTKENINKQLDFLKKAGTNDVVIIFIAGHGVRDTEMKYYFGTNDMDFNSPELRGFSESDLANIMNEIVALRKLVFFDTCLSGEVDKDEAEVMAASTTSTGNVTFRAAGAGLRAKSVGLNNANALMREIYNDITDETGSTIISSAGGVEFAMESAEWKNGLFTFCLLKGLSSMEADANKDKTITVHEIQNYLRKNVYNLSNGKQVPSFKNENKMMDFRIW